MSCQPLPGMVGPWGRHFYFDATGKKMLAQVFKATAGTDAVNLNAIDPDTGASMPFHDVRHQSKAHAGEPYWIESDGTEWVSTTVAP